MRRLELEVWCTMLRWHARGGEQKLPGERTLATSAGSQGRAAPPVGQELCPRLEAPAGRCGAVEHTSSQVVGRRQRSQWVGRVARLLAREKSGKTAAAWGR